MAFYRSQIQNLFSAELFTPLRPVKSAIVGRRATVLIYDLFKLVFCRLILLVKSRAFHKLLGNFLRTSRISRNFVLFEQFLAVGGGDIKPYRLRNNELGSRASYVVYIAPFPSFFQMPASAGLQLKRNIFLDAVKFLNCLYFYLVII